MSSIPKQDTQPVVVTSKAVRFTICVPGFGMSGGLTSELTELLEIIHSQLVAQKMEQDILQSATGQNRSDQCRDDHTAKLTHGYTN